MLVMHVSVTFICREAFEYLEKTA